MKPYRETLAWLLLALIGYQPVFAQVVDPEIERREAAAGFLLPSAMALGVLRRECRQEPQGNDEVERVARAWWERNRDDLDAATWVSAEAMRRYRATLPPEKAFAAQRQISQSMGEAALADLRTTFGRRLPSSELCQKAVQRYKFSQLDVGNLAKTPGYEHFGEFGETLKRVLADKNFRPMEDKFRTFDAQVSVAGTQLLALDAIEAAKARGDAASVVRGFEFMAARGDARAAQTLGLFYLNGQYVPRNVQFAYGWFYNAWAMGFAEGINAIGVIWRDALGVSPDHKLALSAFAVAKQMAAQGPADALQRSATNYARLSPQLNPDEIAAAGCIAWNDLHQKIRQVAEVSGIKLTAPPALPKGNLFDSKTFDHALSTAGNCSY